MIYYVVALLLYSTYYGFLYHRCTSHGTQYARNLPIVLLGMLPLILLVVLRGEVGTDTASYINIISQIAATGDFAGIEPGFTYLVKALLYIANDPLQVCVLVAAITTVVLLIASKSDDRALIVLIVCIVPLFYLDMTMNGLRYGLSFAFAMFAMSKFYHHHLFFSVVLGVVAVLFHVSVLFVFLIAGLLADDKLKFIRWLKLITVVSLVVLAQYYLVDILGYLTEANMHSGLDAKGKYMAYKSFSSPSWYSGLTTLSISWLFLYVLHGGKTQNALLTNQQLLLLISLTLFTFILAKFSYAGLRLQSVVLFAMLLMMQFKPGLAGVMDETRMKGMLMIGYLGLLVFVKNLISTQGQGPSPFAPWHVNPDIVQLWNVING